jgi:outer membrane lipoprotein SlyB
MENIVQAKKHIHPLVAGAAIAVMLVSLTGVAAITGLIPGAHSTPAPEAAMQGTPGSATPMQGQQIAATPQTPSAPVAQASGICKTCGTVEAVEAHQQQPQASGVGMVAGAVIGGILGNQIGHGNGRALATVAGAAGGGYAGNEVEKRTHTVTTYQVLVRMENGNVRKFSYQQQPSWTVGDHVRVVNGRLTSQA